MQVWKLTAGKSVIEIPVSDEFPDMASVENRLAHDHPEIACQQYRIELAEGGEPLPVVNQDSHIALQLAEQNGEGWGAVKPFRDPIARIRELVDAAYESTTSERFDKALADVRDLLDSDATVKAEANSLTPPPPQ